MSAKEMAERLKGLASNYEDVEARTKAADEALLASGEELQTLRAIARGLKVADGDLLAIVAPVASVRSLISSCPRRYCVKDVLAVAEPYLPRLQADFAAYKARRAARARQRRAP